MNIDEIKAKVSDYWENHPSFRWAVIAMGVVLVIGVIRYGL